MNTDELFDRWKKDRASVELDGHFTSRVMDRLPPPAQSRRSRWLVAAVVVLCLGSTAIHLTLVLLLTLAGSNKGS